MGLFALVRGVWCAKEREKKKERKRKKKKRIKRKEEKLNKQKTFASKRKNGDNKFSEE